MGLFTPNYGKPGPGVSPNAPRKTGFARLWEMLSRDFWAFFLAGLLAGITALPYLMGMVLALAEHVVLYVLIAGIVGGMLAAPQVVGMADTVLRSLRDEPGYWWETYRRSWKRNWKASLVPGAIGGLLLGMEVFTFWHMSDLNAGLAMWVMLLISVVMTVGLMGYVVPQIALMDLPLWGMLKNAALLFFAYLPRSLGGLLIQLAYWLAIALLFPYSLYLFPVTNLWLPMVPGLLCIYPALNKSFDIENTIRKMREDDLNAALAKDAEET